MQGFLLWLRKNIRYSPTSKWYQKLEDTIPPFTLPNVLTCQDGTKVEDAATWEAVRRPELLELFAEHVYGRTPPSPIPIDFEVVEEDPKALNGKATRKQVLIYLLGDHQGPVVHVLIYLPNNLTEPVPAFLGLNFKGNQTTQKETQIYTNNSERRGMQSY